MDLGSAVAFPRVNIKSGLVRVHNDIGYSVVEMGITEIGHCGHRNPGRKYRWMLRTKSQQHLDLVPY
jgi:hypothetical protein